MAAESAVRFEALEAQAAALMDLFREAGYEPVAPSIIQPADVFIDRMGEAIRARTYVFTDLDGEELCLRPDLTVPVCRLYLEREPLAYAQARYCYNGPAFRYQTGGGGPGRQREFRQAGIECIGDEDQVAVEAEIVAVAVEAVRRAGLENFTIRLGDIGLFKALIEALAIPDRWRGRLKHHFWRPATFHDVLGRLSRAGDALPEPPLDLRDLDATDPAVAQARVSACLEAEGIPLEGARTLAEITERLLGQAADAREAPLSAEAQRSIEDYLAVSGRPKAVAARIADLARSAGLDLDVALDAFRARLDAFAKRGLDPGAMEFSAVFGRDVEYYTGLVFQIETSGAGRAGQIAGGGRYDELLRDLGAPRPVPAVGCAIHTERLLAAVTGVA